MQNEHVQNRHTYKITKERKEQKKENSNKNKKPFNKKIEKKDFAKIKETNTSDIRMKFYEKQLKSLKFNTLLIPLKGNE